jgi:hypothetical protein
MVAVAATSLSLPALAEHGQPAPRPAQAREKADANAEVIVAHGSNSGKGIDPKLANYKELKNPPFSSYNSYALLDEATRALVRGRAATVSLPDAGELRVVLDNIEEKKGGKRFIVKAIVKRPDGEESTLEVKAKSGATFFVAGQKFNGGILVLGIRIR